MLSAEQIEERKVATSLSRSDEYALQKLLQNYKLTPMTLAMKLNPAIIPARHLMYISTKVATAIAQGRGRIIISLPPRHGKTELVTKNTPIWCLENYGKKNVILCSYGGELSSDFGRYTRDLIKNNESLLNLRIRSDAERVNNWLTDQGGAMFSVGLGGPITGRGADVLIIDDYLKEIKEAMSQVTRDYIWDWFLTTSRTRIEPGGTIIIIATRWHHDDLIGRLLKADQKREAAGKPKIWTNIVIPAIAEKNDVLGRPIGSALFPERYPIEDLLELKDELGSFFFNALYQQRPENDAGQLTNKEWLRYIPGAIDLTGFKIARVWDLAATEDGGDYAVGSLIAHHKGRDMTVILDVVRGQWGPLGIETVVAKTAKEDGKDIPIYIEQEPGSSGKLLVHNYSTTTLKGYTVVGVPASPKTNKTMRAQPFLAAVEAHKVFLMRAPWNSAFEDEYDDFPGGDHDDQVDTCAIGYTTLTGKSFKKVAWARETPTNEQNVIQAVNGSLDNNLIILPNGKVYTLDGLPIEFSSSDPNIPLSPHMIDGLMPKKVGIAWAR